MDGHELVREARRRAGLTQADLAARVGTTQSAIARLERGTTSLTLERATRLVRACGFDLQIRIDGGDWVGPPEDLPPEVRVLRTLEAVVADLRRVVQPTGGGPRPRRAPRGDRRRGGQDNVR